MIILKIISKKETDASTGVLLNGKMQKNLKDALTNILKEKQGKNYHETVKIKNQHLSQMSSGV